MLHTKFHQNLPSGSLKEDFKKSFYYIWHGSHLGHVTGIMLINFHLIVPKSLHSKCG